MSSPSTPAATKPTQVPTRSVVALDGRDTLVKIRTNTPLNEEAKRRLADIVMRGFVLAGRLEIEVL
jgi:L-aminopeptidase/D-esterase-like protein